MLNKLFRCKDLITKRKILLKTFNIKCGGFLRATFFLLKLCTFNISVWINILSYPRKSIVYERLQKTGCLSWWSKSAYWTSNWDLDLIVTYCLQVGQTALYLGGKEGGCYLLGFYWEYVEEIEERITPSTEKHFSGFTQLE